MLLDELTHHRLFDAHLHLPFFTDPVAFAEEARRQGLALFSQAVTPAEYLRLRPMLEPYDNVRQGVGIHPWWIADGRCGDADVDAVVDLMGSTPWVGEVGLDFSPRRPNREGQVAAFRRIARAAGAAGVELEPQAASANTMHRASSRAANFFILFSSCIQVYNP